MVKSSGPEFFVGKLATVIKHKPKPLVGGGLWFCLIHTLYFFYRKLLGERSEPHTGVFNRDFA